MRALAAALGAAALLAPSVVAAPASSPRAVTVRVGADTATGFVVGDNRVVTVAHVLDREVTVDGRRATVVRRDDRLDLALLAVPGVGGDAPRFGRDDARIIRRADARVDGSDWRRPVLELRMDVADGDSGAPVLTPSGRLVGVVFARSSRRPGVAWAVDASAVQAIIASETSHSRSAFSRSSAYGATPYTVSSVRSSMTGDSLQSSK